MGCGESGFVRTSSTGQPRFVIPRATCASGMTKRDTCSTTAWVAFGGRQRGPLEQRRVADGRDHPQTKCRRRARAPIKIGPILRKAVQQFDVFSLSIHPLLPALTQMMLLTLA